MRRVLPPPWLAAALAAALAAGCRHAAPAEPPEMPGQTPVSFRVREAPDASRLVTPPAPPPPARVVPVRHEPAATEPAATEPTQAVVSALSWQQAPAQQAVRLDAPRPLAPRRLAVSDPVVLAHAPDHRWLLGALIYEVRQKRWSVRYTNPGEPDVYGGVLELLDTGPMTGFNSGQLVRVEGELVDPKPHQIKPAFRVLSLRALPTRPN